MELTFDITGGDELIAKLRKLEDKVRVRTMRRVLRYALVPAVEEAKRIVPYDGKEDDDTYSLRDNIGLQAEKKKNRAGNVTALRFGAARQSAGEGDRPGVVISGGLSNSRGAPNYARIIDKKTPFLAPAIERTAAEVIQRFEAKFRKEANKL